jgi:hypothetical protein
MTSFLKGRMPERRVDLRATLKVRQPTAAVLIKSQHRHGGTPLNKSQSGAPAAQPAAVVPVAVAMPTLAEPGAITAAVMERLEAEAAAGTIRRVHDAGGYRLGMFGPEAK